ncbi:hypothetical protein ACR820_34050 [Streptomyces netropsis]
MFAAQNAPLTVNQYQGPDARSVFAGWERKLRRLVVGTLPTSSEPTFALDRGELVRSLATAVISAGPRRAVLVRGEPGVGKSALVLQAIDELRSSAIGVLVTSLGELSAHAGGLDALVAEAVSDPAGAGGAGLHGCLVLDGAEAVQEGCYDLAVEAVCAAVAGGLTPVLVSRDDAVDNLLGMFEDSRLLPAQEFTVPPLNDGETALVLAAAPELAHIARDARSRWLLRRFTLVDLLLRSAGQGTALPAVLSCEADVYAVVWRALVLRNGRTVAGASPDDCGAALVSLAESRLTGRRVHLPTGPALSSLRSMGILAPISEASAVMGEEQMFAHDVLRDFAVARRLLLADGLPLLDPSGPRWAVRAARIFCQVRLWNGSGSVKAFAARWAHISEQFARLAQVHGSRWGEVPWEAMLSAGWCAQALEALREDLSGQPALLDGLLRCVLLRFGGEGACDPVIAAPVVAWLSEHTDVLRRHQQGQEPSLGDQVVLGWLCGVSRLEAVGEDVSAYRPVRVLVRDRLLTSVPCSRPSAAFVEAVALLGPDRCHAAATVLRDLAQSHDQALLPAVERVDPVRALATTDPLLLAEIAAAYYLPPAGKDRKRAARQWVTRGQHEYLGLQLRSQAAWYRGPFFLLLQHSPRHGLALIAALLTAAVQADSPADPWDGDERDPDGNRHERPDLEGSFLGTGLRRYAGGAGAWMWYQGVLNGPQPCISALMALEQHLIRLTGSGAMPVHKAAGLVLHHVGTAAGAGLAYSLLVRNLDHVSDELDPFLACPLVWSFENQRTIYRKVFHRSSDSLPGGDHLQQAPAQVAMSLVTKAHRNADRQRLEQLQAVAQQLRTADPAGVDPLAVENWADHLDWQRYVLVRDGDEMWLIVQPRDDTARQLEKRRALTNRTSQMYAMTSRYRPHMELPHRIDAPEPTDAAQLARDLRAARTFVQDHGTQTSVVVDGISAVAAAAVHAASLSAPSCSDDDLQWAISVLVGTVTDPVPDGVDAAYPWNGCCQAALALPRALLLQVPPDTPLAEKITQGVRQAATHPLREVRRHAVEGMRSLWSVACRAPGGLTCHHIVAWMAVVNSVASAVGTEGASRANTASVSDHLGRLTGHEMLLHPLGIAASAAVDAARSHHCRTADARTLRIPLLSAYARTMCAWAGQRYELKSTDHAALAAALLHTTRTEPACLTNFADQLTTSPRALSHLLHTLKLAATYEPPLARSLGAVWPHLMETVLTQPPCATTHDDSFDAYDRASLLQEVMPNPTPHIADTAVDSTLQLARNQWLPLPPLVEHIEAWIHCAPRSPVTIDNLISFLKAQPLHHQLIPGLRWVHQLLLSNEQATAPRSFLLPEWLQTLQPEIGSQARPHYQAILDTLAQAGDHTARSLQERDE